jgi:hypothetical protein
MAELIHLDTLGCNGPYRARNRVPVSDVTGTPIAELSLVPRLFVQRSIAALRRADILSTDQRVAALNRASHAFGSATINGLSADGYQHAVSRVSGLPISVVRAATGIVAEAAAEAYATTQCSRPSGAINDWRDPCTRRGWGVWTRRGAVFGVHAASNHPGVHALWLEAVAMGYRVAVRPSRREPFTPHRLITAFPSLPPEDDKAVLPVQPLATARAFETFLLRSAEGTTTRLGGDGVVDDLGDGSAVLRPAVFQVHSSDARPTGIELGFPYVWVAPWSTDDGIEPVRNTLVLTAITEDERLIDRLIAEPSIRNIYLGDHPTYWMRPGVPHDGYLAEFLMRTKTMIRG